MLNFGLVNFTPRAMVAWGQELQDFGFPPTMAAKPYDPLVSIEGMFNGSVTRIAQAVKDPLNFGQSTKAVLTECSKRFQDALDDCEIQLLDAKWYLEHQLALNREKREAKAREEGAAVAKRKHDEVKEKGDAEGRSQDAKRAKTDGEQEDKTAKPADVDTVSETVPSKPETASTSDTVDAQPLENALDTGNSKGDDGKETQQTQDISQPTTTNKPLEKAPDKSLEEPPNPMDDFPKTTPQVTPAATNDEFNFESMFGEASADPGGAEDGINFDLNLGDDFAAGLDLGNELNQNSTNADPLMTGLESFDNQAENNGANINDNQAVNFDLPDLGPNEFDAFFNDNNLSGDMNLNDDLMNAENMNMDNLDFDSMFKDD